MIIVKDKTMIIMQFTYFYEVEIIIKGVKNDERININNSTLL